MKIILAILGTILLFPLIITELGWMEDQTIYINMFKSLWEWANK